MYTISTTPGDRVATAATIPDALAALVSQLADQLPHGLVAWKITDPAGTDHRGDGTLNGRLDLLAISIEELVDELYTQLHRAADGGAGSVAGGRPGREPGVDVCPSTDCNGPLDTRNIVTRPDSGYQVRTHWKVFS